MDVSGSVRESSGSRQSLTDVDLHGGTKAPHSHAVQFYEDDAFLVRTIADYVGLGVAIGQPAVVIATDRHRDALAEALDDRGISASRARRAGLLTTLDARATLTAFMHDGMPDRARFSDVIGKVVDQAIGYGHPSGFRAYGEMVDVLWRDGNSAGALALEELWNELLADHNFSLLCGYAISNFSDASQVAEFAAVCGRHTHVHPTERYSEADEPTRLAEISRLQQRALALETEIARRQYLESTLRQAVDERQQLLELERTARAEAEQARAVAEQANRSKSQFLAVMSHELRTPLNAIGGYAELMDMQIHGPVTGGQRDALERIQRSQRHLLTLINQVLNYAKLETGSLRYDIGDVALLDVLQMCETLMLPQIHAKPVTYEPTAFRPDLLVRADAEKLQQIVLNLLGNSLKFTDAGGKITVGVDARPEIVVVRVSDTGIGIPPEKLETIFGAFVQVDTNYTRTRDGVGLGLAISRELARAMGGELTAESVLGAGSTFTLTLPRSLPAISL